MNGQDIQANNLRVIQQFHDILERSSNQLSEDRRQWLESVFQFALQSHDGQVRNNGEPYITHPLQVLDIVMGWKTDTYLAAAALLHDTLEDNPSIKRLQIEQAFGQAVASLVDAVTKVEFRKPDDSVDRIETAGASLKKLVHGSVSDIRVILLKLADRLHNMRTLDYKEESSRQRIAQETIDIYAPFADRVGMVHVKRELTDLSFKHLEQEEFERIRQRIHIVSQLLQKDVEEIQKVLKQHLAQHNTPARIYARWKTPYSIYVQDRSQRSTHFVDINILVSTERDCYTVLGDVHHLFAPLSGGEDFKDLIANMKSNGYQALHTRVLFNGNVYQIQIRTETMERIANLGILSFQDDTTQTHGNMDFNLDTLLQYDLHPKVFYQYLKQDLRLNTVTVFTPNGDRHTFPLGSIVLDFAYRIHTEVGHSAHHATINGHTSTLFSELHQGSVIEIIRSDQARPQTQWLDMVKTSRARQAIEQYFARQRRKFFQQIGQNRFHLQLDRFNRSEAEVLGTDRFQEILTEYSLPNADDLFHRIGINDISSSSVIEKLIPAEELNKVEQKEKRALLRVIRSWFRKRQEDSTILDIQDETEAFVYLAGCCRPLPGEEVIGFVARDRGLEVHRLTCSEIKKRKDLEQPFRIRWQTREGRLFSYPLEIRSRNQPGILAAIAKAFAEEQVNILHSDLRTIDNTGIASFSVQIENRAQLQTILTKLRRINGISSVEIKHSDEETF